jgi:hypothetical protein
MRFLLRRLIAKVNSAKGDRMKNQSRRQFLVYLGAAGLGLGVLTACGGTSAYGGGSNNGQHGDGRCDNGAGIQYTNPGHAHVALNFTAAEVDGAAPGIYALLGGSHTHTFDIQAADFATIKGGGAVQKTDLEGHGHIISISC